MTESGDSSIEPIRQLFKCKYCTKGVKNRVICYMCHSAYHFGCAKRVTKGFWEKGPFVCCRNSKTRQPQVEPKQEENVVYREESLPYNGVTQALDIHVIKSRKGNNILMVNGVRFHRLSQLSGGRYRWRCFKYKIRRGERKRNPCQAQFCTLGDENHIVQPYLRHNHYVPLKGYQAQRKNKIEQAKVRRLQNSSLKHQFVVPKIEENQSDWEDIKDVQNYSIKNKIYQAKVKRLQNSSLKYQLVVPKIEENQSDWEDIKDVNSYSIKEESLDYAPEGSTSYDNVVDLTEDYIENKYYEPSPYSQHPEHSAAYEAKKMFILSLLPDLKQMTDVQKRDFKEKIFDIINSLEHF